MKVVKLYANAIAEVREAVDFLRYYATQIENLPANAQVKPLGTVLCISPWNFPLAIFSGQIAAALVSGNCVIAKPAEQTPLIAAQAVQMLWEAGVPHAVVQLLPGRGKTVGAQLSQDDRIQGIMFTGSTEVAKIFAKNCGKTFISKWSTDSVNWWETGGQNAMIVDSSALTEQVVLDVVSSAFDSAGQRCSALRILCVQEDSAATVIKMLKGAMQQLDVGNPAILKTDIGPVIIDIEAKQTIDTHIQKMKSKGYPVHQLMFNDAASQQAFAQGTFVPPTESSPKAASSHTTTWAGCRTAWNSNAWWSLCAIFTRTRFAKSPAPLDCLRRSARECLIPDRDCLFASWARCHPEKLDIIRKANAIVEEEVMKFCPWQAFAALLGMATGVKGDNRVYAGVVAVRSVTSRDAATADVMEISWDVLRRISSRITGEIPSVARVVYDLTPKPPGTIEFE